MIYRIVPLSSGFALTSILGFLITVFFVFPRAIYTTDAGAYACHSIWLCSLATVLAFFFALMFIASIISMTYSPLEAEFDIKKEKKRKIKKIKD